jgi:hypothetical protein
VVSYLPAQKLVKDQRELSLFQQTVAEQDPGRKIQLINSWSAEYTASDFHSERLKLLAAACRDAQEIDTAVSAVTKLHQLEPDDLGVSLLILSTLQRIQTPSQEQLSLTRTAAKHLLSRSREWGLARSGLNHVVSGDTEVATDPEVQRLLDLLRVRRRQGLQKRIRKASEAEQEIRAVAEGALRWTDSRPR